MSNVTYGCLFMITTLSYVPHVRTAIIVSCVLNGIISLAAVMGNILVLVTIYKTPSLHTPAKSLVFMMASADAGVGLFAQPAAIARNVIALYLAETKMESDNQQRLESAFCVTGIASEVFGGFFVYFSLICLTAISFERFLAIHVHLRYAQLVTVPRTIKASVPMLIPPLIITIMRLNSAGWGASFAALIVVGAVTFFACLAVILYSNAKIATTLRRHTLQIASQRVECVQEPFSLARRPIVLARFRRSVSTMLLILLLFLLCFLPYGCVGLVVIHTASMTSDMYIAAYSTIPVIYLNSGLNPLIYFWRMKEMRQAACAVTRISTVS